MSELWDLNKHLSECAMKERGARMNVRQVMLLYNSVGETLAAQAAEEVKKLCSHKLSSTPEGGTGWSATSEAMERHERRITRSSGMTRRPDETATKARAHRICRKRKTP